MSRARRRIGTESMLVYDSLECVMRCVLCGVDIVLVLWVTSYVSSLFWESLSPAVLSYR